MRKPILSLIALAASSGLLLATDKKPEDFDKLGNKNGRLDGNEIPGWLLYLRKTPMSDVDTDGDGLVSKAERDAWMGKFDVQVVVQPKIQADGSMKFDDVRKIFRPGEPEKVDFIQPFKATINGKETALQLRKSLSDVNYDGITASGEDKIKALKDAAPATFGFYRDYLNGEDTWTAEGVLAYPIGLPRDFLPSGWDNIGALSFVPSVEFNRITGKGGGKFESETNVLSFRGGLWADAAFQDSLIDSLIVSTNYRGTTNFGFDDPFLSAVELDLEPTTAENMRLGVGYADVSGLDGLLRYQTRATAHFEYGQYLTGDVRTSASRIGPRINLNLKLGTKFPKDLQRLQFFTRYDHLWTLSGDYDDVDYFEAGLRMPLDANEQILLEASYKRGEIPIKFTDTDLLTVGLAVKF